jgi:hypothetical protein
MLKIGFGSFLSIFILTAPLWSQSREAVLKSLGQDSKWVPAAEATEYDEHTIEKLAGNRSPAILRYGFIGAAVQDWKGPKGRTRLALYEMADPSAAYGLFTLERNLDQAGVTTIPLGTEGFRYSHHICFWQSKYLVKLEGDNDSIEQLGHIVSENIFGRSRKPPVSNHLPSNNLVQGTDRYVVDPDSVDRRLGLDASKLGFEDSAEMATANYRVGGKSAVLVLLLYPTQQLAKKYADQLDAASSDDAPFRKRVGALVALVRGSRDPSVAEQILDAVNYESKVTWNERRPDLSLRDLILTIFTGIGIGLLFTVVAGISFGGVRIFVKSRYPDRVFDRSVDMEIIQLKLSEAFTRKELRE